MGTARRKDSCAHASVEMPRPVQLQRPKSAVRNLRAQVCVYVYIYIAYKHQFKKNKKTFTTMQHKDMVLAFESTSQDTLS